MIEKGHQLVVDIGNLQTKWLLTSLGGGDKIHAVSELVGGFKKDTRAKVSNQQSW
jgi:hypothetical protein